MKRGKRHIAGAFGIGAIIGFGIFMLGQYFLPHTFSFDHVDGLGNGSTTPQVASTTAKTASTTAFAVTHVPTPAAVHGIYMSQCAVGTPSFRASLEKLIAEGRLNSIVIDIKDYSGGIAFPTSDPMLAPYVSLQCGAKDMKRYIASLHAKGIYVIGRITVFQDPTYAAAHPELAVKTKEGGIWENYGGLAFIDVGAKPFWAYIVELGKVAYEDEGFDELNFDYVRFPSDGPLSDADYTFDRGTSKATALEAFFKYLHDGLAPTGVVMSADLFGYTTVHTDDLGIGQELERALPYFDYIDPMVYPSHYSSGFLGLADVNSDPYKIVNVSLSSAIERALAPTTTIPALDERPIASTSPQAYVKPVFAPAKIRPWLQSFDYPVAYTPAMVEAQIRATDDAGLQSWLFWDAGNKYASLKQVLTAPPASTTP